MIEMIYPQTSLFSKRIAPTINVETSKDKSVAKTTPDGLPV